MWFNGMVVRGSRHHSEYGQNKHRTQSTEKKKRSIQFSHTARVWHEINRKHAPKTEFMIRRKSKRERSLCRIYDAYAEFLVWLMMALIQSTSTTPCWKHFEVVKWVSHLFLVRCFCCRKILLRIYRECVRVIKYMSWKTCTYLWYVKNVGEKWSKQWKKKKKNATKKEHTMEMERDEIKRTRERAWREEV